ncbi:DUF1311 domain-containing protein [Rhodobacterales bacterium HKCCE3408]|nr:DUF1311 domain-containing protein [Rhodobacterales bacterium HKCCE3408]
MRALALFMLLAAPASAQEPPYSDAPVEACLASDAEPATCIGAAAASCRAALPNETTLDIIACNAGEVDFWQGRIDTVYAELQAAAAEFDAQYAGTDAGNGLIVPATVPMLTEMQALWRAYRDRVCNFEVAPFLGGTIRGPIAGSCRLQVNATRALELERLQWSWGG